MADLPSRIPQYDEHVYNNATDLLLNMKWLARIFLGNILTLLHNEESGKI